MPPLSSSQAESRRRLLFTLPTVEAEHLGAINAWAGRTGGAAFQPYEVERRALRTLADRLPAMDAHTQGVALERFMDHPDGRVVLEAIEIYGAVLRTSTMLQRSLTRRLRALMTVEHAAWSPLHDVAAVVWALPREGGLDRALASWISETTDPDRLTPLLEYKADLVRDMLARHARRFPDAVFQALYADPRLRPSVSHHAGLTDAQLSHSAADAMAVLQDVEAGSAQTGEAIATLRLALSRSLLLPETVRAAALHGVSAERATPRHQVVELILNDLIPGPDDLLRLHERAQSSHAVTRDILAHPSMTPAVHRVIALSTRSEKVLTDYARSGGNINDPAVRDACRRVGTMHLLRLLIPGSTPAQALDYLTRIAAKGRHVALEIIESGELPDGFEADADLMVSLLRTGNQELRLRAYMALSHLRLAPGAEAHLAPVRDTPEANVPRGRAPF